jgi:hypothetical protein
MIHAEEATQLGICSYLSPRPKSLRQVQLLFNSLHVGQHDKQQRCRLNFAYKNLYCRGLIMSFIVQI